ncbi:MAG: type II toxin-antitoxin system prevent-host-death family antitoxin [Acidobacteriota bacterium]|nr:type II toxin-antitoxin system prevent-host-death family antitoxin [Acidobacteriota bacterium]
MPQIVPVSDFRADLRKVSEHTDRGEIVILTQNGRPRWAMIDYDEWNAASRAQERSFARVILETERRERDGELGVMDGAEARARLRAHRAPCGEE